MNRRKFIQLSGVSMAGLVINTSAFGSKESIIEDIRFSNLTFELTDSKLNDVAGGNIDLRGAMRPA